MDEQLAAAYSKLLATVPTEARATVRQIERDHLGVKGVVPVVAHAGYPERERQLG